jgi:hypothetical protein
MNQPNREPDFKLEGLWFYFKEMVQWNVGEGFAYSIRLTEENGLEYFSFVFNRWHGYKVSDRNVIYENYVNWLVENILLEQL